MALFLGFGLWGWIGWLPPSKYGVINPSSLIWMSLPPSKDGVTGRRDKSAFAHLDELTA